METTTPEKPDRKTIERNRRIHMKGLIDKLTSLVPHQHFKPSKDMLSQQDQLDQVAGYIKQLRESVEKLEKRKQEHMASSSQSDKNVENSTIQTPIVEVRDLGSSLEVVIISGKKKELSLHQIVRIVEEEGAEVVSASIHSVGLNVYHILHAQVKVLRFGVDSSMILDRFQTLLPRFTTLK